MMNHHNRAVGPVCAVAMIIAASALVVGATIAGPTTPTASLASSTQSAATRPAGPSTTMPADQLLQQMLRPAGAPAARPLTPVENLPTFNETTGRVTPPAPPSPTLIREGDYIRDRIGRLNRTADGQFEFVFESDGQAMKDPPILILPNLKLMQMETAVTSGNRDLKFRITGQVTEYKGRNYILIDKAVVPPDPTQQF
jgi:hypothetical protein